jgi:glycosyltransferase involved in cell wall biosynthesis|nr:glycosyltransferase family 2 protein [uncultured Thiocystis sp.]
MPKFSIVTISYNQAGFLEETILSILNQGHPNVEYIVVDAGSTDGSRDLIKQYRNKISTVILEPDRGPADGLNKGFDEATGDWLAFINADDALAVGALYSIDRFLEDHPDVDIVLGAGHVVDSTGALIKPIRPMDFTMIKWLYGGADFIQQGMFFRRSTYEKTRRFNVDNRTCWDAELLIDMLLAGAKLACHDDVLGLFRIHGESISGTGRLNAAYKIDTGRLFEKAMGRTRSPVDNIISLYYRIAKWLSHPLYYAKRYVHENRRHHSNSATNS